MAVPPLRLRFVTSAPDADRLHDSPAEVAVAGRSNVGKSSVINALANRKGLAQVSKAPGRTRLLNEFELDEGSAPHPTLVDLPGYGYANVPHRVKAQWGPMIEGYLLQRPQLQMTLLLVDGEVGPTALDLGMLEWVRHHEVPHTLVATKHDKVRSARRDKRRRELSERCGVASGDVLWVSAAKGVNIDTLRARVRDWLGGSQR